MKQVKAIVVLVAGLAAMPATAYAQLLAYTSTVTKLRAGPDRQYPPVAVLPAGIEVSVFGCLGDYRWCDVAAGFERGWVYAGNIAYPFGNAYVPLLSYGPTIGIGIIAFDRGHYWGRHYRDRPWYAHRHRWPVEHHAPPLVWRSGLIAQQRPLPDQRPPFAHHNHGPGQHRPHGIGPPHHPGR